MPLSSMLPPANPDLVLMQVDEISVRAVDAGTDVGDLVQQVESHAVELEQQRAMLKHQGAMLVAQELELSHLRALVQEMAGTSTVNITPRSTGSRVTNPDTDLPPTANTEKAQNMQEHATSVSRPRVQVKATPAEIKEEVSSPDEKEIEGSVWEMPIVIGTVPMGDAAALWLRFLVVLNMFIQSFFIYTIKEFLIVEAISDTTIRQYADWRITTAHAIKNMITTPAGESSMARQVCEGDNGLTVSTSQLSDHSNLVAYLGGSDANNTFTPGLTLCLFALLIWCMTVIQELRGAVRFTRAILRLPTGKGTCSMEPLGGGNIEITSLTRERKVVCIFLQLVRATIAILLAIYGSTYLVQTVNLGDLILNMLALDFVMNIDELIFECCAPSTAKRIQAKLEPLEVAVRVRQWRGLDTWGPASFCTACIITSLYVGISLVPQQDQLRLGRDALCAGNLDFVYSISGFGAVTWSQTDPIGHVVNANSWPAHKLGPLSHSLAALVGPLNFHTTDCGVCFQGQRWSPQNASSTISTSSTLDECCLAKQASVPSAVIGRFSVRAFEEEAPENSLRVSNPGCSDALHPPALRSNPSSFLDDNGNNDAINIFRSALGDEVDDTPCGGCPSEQAMCVDGSCVVPTCEIVHRMGLCQSQTAAGVRSRQFCPVTCGCTVPTASLVLDKPGTGCPPSCSENAPYQAVMAALTENCTDMSHTEGPFHEFLSNITVIAQGWPNSIRALATIAAGVLQQFGCPMMPVLRQTTGFNFCSEFGTPFGTKSFSFFCPVACGCAQDGECPFRCRASGATR